jgi:hypothetical protein
MLVSKQEARKTKIEHPVQFTSFDTSFDNDKHHFYLAIQALNLIWYRAVILTFTQALYLLGA